jgi:hypothetical protein
MDNGSSVSAAPKIQIPNFGKMLLESFRGAALATWDKFELRHNIYFKPALIGIGCLIFVWVTFWVYTRFIR